MKRKLLFIALMIAAVSIPLRQSATAVQNRPSNKDEEALKELINEWAMCVVKGDSEGMEMFMADNFMGSADGNVKGTRRISFDKRTLKAVLKSGQMKVGDWKIDQVTVRVSGNSATATGVSTLTDATYMGQPFGGKWTFSDRFEKQNGHWRAVSSTSRRIK